MVELINKVKNRNSPRRYKSLKTEPKSNTKNGNSKFLKTMYNHENDDQYQEDEEVFQRTILKKNNKK